MDVPYNWLKSYLDFDLNPDELAHKLTMLGLEVENVDFLGSGLEDIIVGQIKKVEDHPNADNLSICQVETGEGKKQIVCGAPNVKSELLVPVAPVDTVLPGGQKVKKVELRGIESSGMICSADELGLQEERADGIMELKDEIISEQVQPGDSFISVYGLDEYVLQLDLTPNYARCLGLLGIARELSAVMKEKEVDYPDIELEEKNPESNEQLPEIKIKDQAGCPRYTARLLTDIEVGSSPQWMQKRLESAGVRPINNIVDITNYVLLEYNQPLHAFDYHKVAGKKIIIRRAQEGEKIFTLDEQERELATEDLVIADEKQPIALAGVMGGAESEVSKSTETVLLEAACFDPVSIRKTSSRFGLSSDASHRFERGIDIEKVVEASNRAAQLMKKYAGARIVGEPVDEYPRPYEPLEISLDPARINDLLGIDLKDDKIMEILEKLEFKVEESVSDILQVEVPSFRNDVEQEADLVEEVARMFGYNKIPVTSPPSLQRGEKTEAQIIRDQVHELMGGMGMDEIITFSLEDKNIYDQLEIDADSELRKWVELKNPLNESFAILRTSLIPSLIETLSSNNRRQQQELRFYELGKVFKNIGQKERPEEKRKLAGGSSGYHRDIWDNDTADFYYLKGVIENLFKRLKMKFPQFKSGNITYLHPGRTAEIHYKGQQVGFLGEIAPDKIEEFDLQKRTAVFQLDFSVFKNNVDPHSFEFNSLPKFPPVARDLALVVPEEVPAAKLLDEIDDQGGELLKQVNLFDVYEGEQIEESYKSLAFELLFQAEDRTLTDEEVNNIFNEIVNYLSAKYDISVRK